VSAAEPERRQKIPSDKGVSLSVTRFETYDPEEVRESAAIITPPLYSAANIVVYFNKIFNTL